VAEKGQETSKTRPEGIQKRLVRWKNQKTSVVPNRVDSSVEMRSKEGRTAAVVGVAVRGVGHTQVSAVEVVEVELRD